AILYYDITCYRRYFHKYAVTSVYNEHIHFNNNLRIINYHIYSREDIKMSTNEQNHPFDKATTLTFQDGVFKGKTSEAYANMVGPFGGVIAAQLLQAVIEHPDCQGEPIALTINYAAPVIDGDFIIKANPARTNRSTQHWVIELSQADGVVITGTALTAKRRETWSTTELEMPDVPGPEKVPVLPSQGLPTWVRN